MAPTGRAYTAKTMQQPLPVRDDFLLPIGPFARLSLLSPKMLRQYDSQGLLRPAKVDTGTGYRYYSYSQLRTAEMIRLLRSFDVPLTTVRSIIDQGDENAWDEALAAQRRRLVARLEAMQGTLERLDSHLRLRPGIPACEAALRDEPDLLVAGERRRVSSAGLDPFIDQAIDLLEERAGTLGLRPAGREIVLYHSVSLTDDDLTVEVCRPLEDAGGAPPAGCRRLPGGPHAVTIHTGPWTDIRTTYCGLFVWMADHGLQPGTPQRERYLADDRDTADHDDFITEIAWPIERDETRRGRRASLPPA